MLNTTTTVTPIDDFDVDGFLSDTPPATSPVVEEEKKPGVFSNPNPDLEFLDPAKLAEEGEETTDSSSADPLSPEELERMLNPDEQALQEQGQTTSQDAGSPLIDTFSKLIKDNVIVPFDDDKPIEQYSTKDWQELLTANLEEKERRLREEIPNQFFSSLPEELQLAAKYVQDGGTDLKTLFSHLARTQEVRELSLDDESGQEAIARQYLQATGYSEDLIDDEINTWKDLGTLEKKARAFKPHLDKYQEQAVQQQLAQQEQERIRREQQSQMYMDNVFNTLKTGELNGMKLTPKTQSQLYAGLVQPSYKSEISGRPTNLLGHLLEKYQFIEPNHALVSEALWLLSNPDEYRSNIAKQGRNTAIEETARKLKGASASERTATGIQQDAEPQQRRGIPRPQKNFFQR